jgi:hypothetical protein
MSARAVLGALQAVAATAVECGLTAEFGVEWIPRADGRGNEIKGISQAQMDAYSTRTVHVREKERELARAWERRHGRAPTSRELLYIANDATLRSRTGKDAGPIDWDALAARWDATLSGELASIAPMVSDARGPGVRAREHHGGRASAGPPPRELGTGRWSAPRHPRTPPTNSARPASRSPSTPPTCSLNSSKSVTPAARYRARHHPRGWGLTTAYHVIPVSTLWSLCYLGCYVV